MPETFMCYAGKIYHLTYERSIILHLHLLRQIPLIHSVYSLFYINLMLPSQTMQFAYIRQLAHSAVGLRSVKSQFALIAHFFDNLIRQLSDGDFFSRTDIDMAVTDILGTGCVCILKVHMLHDIDTGIGHFLTP